MITSGGVGLRGVSRELFDDTTSKPQIKFLFGFFATGRAGFESRLWRAFFLLLILPRVVIGDCAASFPRDGDGEFWGYQGLHFGGVEFDLPFLLT